MFSDDDYVDPHEYDDLMASSQEALAKDILSYVKKNKDNKTKEVGDRVLIWDTSRLTYADTNEFVKDPLDEQLATKFSSIVIETDCKYDAELTFGERRYNVRLDLVIWNDVLGKKLRTSSEFVKIVTK